MRVFLYEDITGGGSLDVPHGSLFREGAAMLRALVEDFSAVPGLTLTVLQDERLAFNSFELMGDSSVNVHRVTPTTWQDALLREASAAEQTLVIAPEIDNRLTQLCRLIESEGGSLLGPNSKTANLFSDKYLSCQWLAARRIASPPTHLITANGSDSKCSLLYPLVVKPRFGAGSHEVRSLATVAEFDAWRRRDREPADYCWQPLIDGESFSVSMLCGAGQRLLLPVTRQILSRDGAFRYLGGETICNSLEQAKRANRLARLVADALPCTQGFIGIDIVLGATECDDRVIEINPRLTTSYVGLRKVIDNNLAECMLDVAHGRDVDLQRRRRQVRFLADGRLAADDSILASSNE